MDGRTADNGPWHKLAGLRPVELKTWPWQKGLDLGTTEKLTACLIVWYLTPFQWYFSYIATESAPIYAFLVHF